MSIKILRDHKVEEIKGIHLFGASGSNNYMRAALMLEEKQLIWQSHNINLLKYEQFEPEYLNINPQGSIPAMIHDGTAIYGSENILKYLEKMFPNPSLTACDKENEMWEWVESASRTHIETAIGYLYSKKGGRPIRKDMVELYKKHNPEKLRFIQERGYHMTKEQAQEVVNINHAKMLMLDERLSLQEFILGNKVTVADIAWLPDPIFLKAIGFNLSPYRNVQNWMKRMRKRDSHNKKTKLPAFKLKIAMFYLRWLSKNESYIH
jgi:glutathione S-transferase